MLFKVPQDARHTSASQPLGVALTAASLLCSFCQNQKHIYQHSLHGSPLFSLRIFRIVSSGVFLLSNLVGVFWCFGGSKVPNVVRHLRF